MANKDNDLDNEFEIENNATEETSPELIAQRLKEFSYYLAENVEKNLGFCLNLLEERAVNKKPNSFIVTAISTLSLAIPYVGKGVNAAVSKGEYFILDKIDKKNSRALADLVYYYSDNKGTIRQTIIESSVDLFYSFENQYMKLTCNGGPKRAMQKLAKDAANRIFTHFLETSQSKEVSRNEMVKGVLFGNSVRNKVGMKTGRTTKDDKDRKWKTSKIYSNTGLFVFSTNEFFKNEHTKSEKYGYRRNFAWEDLEEIRKNWQVDSASEVPKYYLKEEDFPSLYTEIREYIMTKSAEEEARLDREKKQQESMDDRETKHEEVLKKINEVLEDVENYYLELVNRHHENKVIIEAIQEKQEAEAGGHQEISQKLTEIHNDVIVTKDGQIQLQGSTNEIKEKISSIETKQEECASAMVQIDETVKQVAAANQDISLSSLVKDNHEVKRLQKNVKVIERDVRRKFKKIF